MAAKPFDPAVREGVVRRLVTEQHEGTQVEAATALAYGEATTKDAVELHEEGIDVLPLPKLPDEAN